MHDATRALPCWILPFEVADGYTNMARDEAMLELVASGPPRAAFRAYGWSTPTLSLGYFQSSLGLDADSRWRDAPIVRRPTGGGAIWHDRELTYALALPADTPMAARPLLLYGEIHRSIAAALSQFGAEVSRRGNPDGSPIRAKPFLCFEDRDPEDLVSGTHKVAGSSQRRRGRTVLQHGSILLAASGHTPQLLGLKELHGLVTEIDALARALAGSVTSALGLIPVNANWPESFQTRVLELVESTYSRDEWLRKR